MSDLIRRTDVIDFLEQHRQSILIGSAGYTDANEISDTIKVFKTILSSPLTIKSVTDTNIGGKWIPCSERLPETHEDTKSSDVVLVCGYDKKIDFSWQAMGFYVNTNVIKRWFFAECKDTETPIDWIDIIAWMPLPEPYKGE